MRVRMWIMAGEDELARYRASGSLRRRHPPRPDRRASRCGSSRWNRGDLLRLEYLRRLIACSRSGRPYDYGLRGDDGGWYDQRGGKYSQWRDVDQWH
jgi:hypothetical protein